MATRIGDHTRGRASFMHLPLDLKLVIVQSLASKADLRSLALACKQTYRLSIPELYNSMVVEVSENVSNRLLNKLGQGNQGLRCVRHVHFNFYIDDDGEVTAKMHDNARQILAQLMRLLPWNSLLSFHATSDMVMEVDWVAEILARHTCLRSLSVNTVGHNCSEVDATGRLLSLGGSLRSIEALYLTPQRTHDLKICHQILSHSSRLRTLHLHLLPEREAEWGLDPEIRWNDSSNGPGLLTRTLFRLHLPFGSGQPPIKLCELDLVGIHLGQASYTYAHIIDLTYLTRLSIADCSSTADLIHALSQRCGRRRDGLSLRSLRVCGKHDRTMRLVESIENLLEDIRGLEEIAVELEDCPRVLSAQAIVLQAETLKYLRVHSWTKRGSYQQPREERWHYQDLLQLCLNAPKLKALACAFPRIWALEGAKIEFLSFLCAVRRLPALRTLNISTYPILIVDGKLIESGPYLDLVAGIAKRIFDWLNYGQDTMLRKASAIRHPQVLDQVAVNMQNLETAIINRQESQRPGSSTVGLRRLRQLIIGTDAYDSVLNFKAAYFCSEIVVSGPCLDRTFDDVRFLTKEETACIDEDVSFVTTRRLEKVMPVQENIQGDGRVPRGSEWW
ncbi:hypothetical protein BDZ85DRAFT_300523 [Elsinoe ampelina]|uniref:F-box domain-containing protein n=1 Tax=Elsinoe ampelina TaxID=302913 RepID=A0A6A6GPQ0_9PEZI|nr:hypothetical protein BDZ85DRAFT_300523 [Elsinoe ampelina]